MFRQSLLFMFEFCQELLFNSYNRSDIFAWLLACCNRLFLTLEEIILEHQTAFLGPFSIQGLIPWKSAWTVSLQGQSVLMSRVMILTLLISRVKILLFALLFSGFWTPLSNGHCSQDWFQFSHPQPSSFVIMGSSRTPVPTQSSIIYIRKYYPGTSRIVYICVVPLEDIRWVKFPEENHSLQHEMSSVYRRSFPFVLPAYDTCNLHLLQHHPVLSDWPPRALSWLTVHSLGRALYTPAVHIKQGSESPGNRKMFDV